MNDLVLTILMGVLFCVSGVSVGLWQILSSPDQPNYPTSGAFKRTLMFWIMVAMLVCGTEVLTLASDGTGLRVTFAQVGTLLLVTAFFVTMLVDHCQHWLPARTQARIRQLRVLARCRPSRGLVAARKSAMKASTGEPCQPASVVSPALVELTLNGSFVSGPNEGPEAFQ